MAKKTRKKHGQFEVAELRDPSKTLLTNIRFSSLDKPIKTITVTSSIMDEGKSTVSSNLACAMASSGKRTLIMDCDLRRRSLGAMLKLHAPVGIYSVLSGEASLNDAIIPTGIPNLYFFDCEPKIPNPPDVLSSERFSVLLNSLRETFDYVVIDTPPAGLFVDSSIVAHQSDGTIMVVRQNFAKRVDVQNAMSQLKAADANVLGAVMTFVPKEDNGYYYYSYRYYNEEGGSKKKDAAPEESDLEVLESGLLDSDVSDWAKQVDVASKPTSSRSARSEKTAGGRHGRPAGSGSDSFAPGSFKNK